MLFLLFGLVFQMHLAYPDQDEKLGVTLIVIFAILTVSTIGSMIY